MAVPDNGDADIVHVLFHGIGTPGPGVSTEDQGYFVGKSLFLAVLDEMAGRPQVRLSFDDGYASDVEIALPAVIERGLHARFFPLAGQLGRPGYLSEAGVRELASAGMRVGSHGMRHRSWRGMDPRARQEELIEARRVLEEAAGSEIDTAACPFGAYDRTVLVALREQAYTTIFTSDRRRARAGAWLQPRYSVQRADTIQTVRDDILARPRLTTRARGALAARIKAWR
jgi:peptidoglycan/xylan/chitin deacetylase (PgdA/CDA1 family)